MLAEMAVKVKTSNNLFKFKWAEEKNPRSAHFIFFFPIGKIRVGRVRKTKK